MGIKAEFFPTSATESRVQFAVEIKDSITLEQLRLVPAMLIHTGEHWCGYVKSPNDSIPQMMERVEIDSHTRPTPTFYGPSGPIINWLQMDSEGKYGQPNSHYEDHYWIGFDLQANPAIDKFEALKFLTSFVETLYGPYC